MKSSSAWDLSALDLALPTWESTDNSMEIEYLKKEVASKQKYIEVLEKKCEELKQINESLEERLEKNNARYGRKTMATSSARISNKRDNSSDGFFARFIAEKRETYLFLIYWLLF